MLIFIAVLWVLLDLVLQRILVIFFFFLFCIIFPKEILLLLPFNELFYNYLLQKQLVFLVLFQLSQILAIITTQLRVSIRLHLFLIITIIILLLLLLLLLIIIIAILIIITTTIIYYRIEFKIITIAQLLRLIIIYIIIIVLIDLGRHGSTTIG